MSRKKDMATLGDGATSRRGLPLAILGQPSPHGPFPHHRPPPMSAHRRRSPRRLLRSRVVVFMQIAGLGEDPAPEACAPHQGGTSPATSPW
jgi:hypothetical protein